jgi:hypothetical protein
MMVTVTESLTRIDHDREYPASGTARKMISHVIGRFVLCLSELHFVFDLPPHLQFQEPHLKIDE